MFDILHRVGCEAPIARVYEALATRNGLAGWWTEKVTGDDHVGGILVFGFADPAYDPHMKVLELVPNHRVAWECVKGPPEWTGTRLAFELRDNEGETVVLFSQRGWKEQVEFMHACSTKWGLFLMSLKALVEKGIGKPDPHDITASRWF
jgi:uncharacterized protein YndB with AHSA1/START domain